VYSYAKQAVRQHPGADGLYQLGDGWSVVDIIEEIEQDLRIPVVHPVPARIWAIQKRLQINQPVDGVGRLLATLP
jgi:maleate cis-trans isomerase